MIQIIIFAKSPESLNLTLNSMNNFIDNKFYSIQILHNDNQDYSSISDMHPEALFRPLRDFRTDLWEMCQGWPDYRYTMFLEAGEFIRPVEYNLDDLDSLFDEFDIFSFSNKLGKSLILEENTMNFSFLGDILLWDWAASPEPFKPSTNGDIFETYRILDILRSDYSDIESLRSRLSGPKYMGCQVENSYV